MKRILAAALAATLLVGPVLAEAGDRNHSRHEVRGSHGHHHHGKAHHHDLHVVRHVHHPVRFHAGHYHRPVGYRHQVWHVGARLPAAYCAPRYIVHDYHVYHLHRPPRGYHWVRVDNDVVLTAIATGVIAAVVHDLFY
ncbi:MAG TPA: RcnB family protein [Steroidobacteraceae bacterium]